MTDPIAADDRAPLLAPPSYAVDAKPLAGYYQSTGTTASWRMEDAVPPGPLSEAGNSSAGNSSSANTSTLHATTVWQTFIHLAKGYIGVGMLSLPWALSQLGIVFGVVAVFVMSFWSSYNCWTVVRVKRFIEGQRNGISPGAADVSVDDVSESGSAATTNTNITYPDVGEWAYGKTFQKYVR
jgi:proton-coupled amino acid transporter